MPNFIEPLDLQSILVNTLSGNLQIFIFIAFITIGALAARFRMPTIIASSMFALFIFMLAAYMKDFYFLTWVVASVILSYAVGIMIRRS